MCDDAAKLRKARTQELLLHRHFCTLFHTAHDVVLLLFCCEPDKKFEAACNAGSEQGQSITNQCDARLHMLCEHARPEAQSSES